MEGKLKGEQTHLLFPLPKIIRVRISRFSLEVAGGRGPGFIPPLKKEMILRVGMSDDLVFASLAAIIFLNAEYKCCLHHIFGR